MKDKIIEILEMYINENKDIIAKRDKLKTDKDLYKELLNYLNQGIDTLDDNKLFISTLLDIIYEDTIQTLNFYSLLYKINSDNYNSKNEYISFIAKIKSDFTKVSKEIDNLNNRIGRSSYMVSNAYKVLKILKYKNYMTFNNFMIKDLKKIIEYFEINGHLSTKEALLCINEVENHNRRIATSKNNNVKEKEYAESLYNEIPNILNSGYVFFEKLPEVENDKRKMLDNLSNGLLIEIKSCKHEEIEETLNKYLNINLEMNEFNYLLSNTINGFDNELYAFYELLLDRETHYYRQNRSELFDDYYISLKKYLSLINFYSDNVEDIVIEEADENEELPEEQVKACKQLIFSYSPATPTKAKIISDMSKLPYEYYDRVINLISEFKDGTISSKKFKPLKNNANLKAFTELKDDQVRIVMKHTKDDIYTIMGVFVKKSDNAMKMYHSMANRIIPNIDTEDKLNKQLELGIHAEEELIKLVEKDKRKGTR